MASKKKSSSKVGPVLVLAAILAGGYYWYSTESAIKTTEQKQSKPNFTYVSDIPTDLDDDIPQEELVIEDSVVTIDDVAHSDIPNVKPSIQETKHTPKKKTVNTQASTKNAYIDEYGNVIYTKPNGKDPITYKTYTQGRWGYAINYPTFLNKERHAQTSDGGTFEDGKGKKLVTYASWNVFNESIYELYHKEFPESESVTYKKLFRKQKCYVKSGYTKDNRIFYMKEAIYDKDEQEVVATLIFYYPKSYKNEAEKVIKEVFSAFPRKIK